MKRLAENFFKPAFPCHVNVIATCYISYQAVDGMPRKSVKRTSSRKTKKTGRSPSSRLSPRTVKQIDALPVHARHIYKNAHKNALKQYASPSKRRGGKRQSKEQVAHKVAWSAVKKRYQKEGEGWVPKD